MAAEAPITIALKATGTGQVLKAVGAVSAAIDKLDTASLASSKKASDARLAIFKNEMQTRLNMAKQLASEISKSDRAISRSLAPSTRKRPSKAEEAAGDAGSSLLKTGVFGASLAIMSKGIDVVSGALGQFGGFLMNDIIKPQLALEKFAIQLENSSQGAIKSNLVMDRARSIQARWNIDAMEAANVAASLADQTGDMKVAFDAVDDIAMLSKGYGADTGELSQLAAAIYNLDQSMGKQGLQKAMFTQLAQGQVSGGRFTIKDIAGLGGELVKNASSLQGDAQGRLASIGAALQTGGITGKADVSMTNLNAFIVEASAKLKGTKAVNDKGQIADLGVAIREALTRTGGNAGKIRTMGFSDTSSSFLMQYMTEFQKALKEGASAADAAASATATFEKMRQAVADESSVRAAANKVMMSASERYETAINMIKDRIQAMMPQMTAVINNFVNKAPQLVGATMNLTKVFIAIGDLLAKLIPETDTRTRRSFEKEAKKQKLQVAMEEKSKEIEGIDQELAERKRKRRLTPFALHGQYDAETAELEARRQRATESLHSMTGEAERLNTPEKEIDDAALTNILANSSRGFGTLADYRFNNATLGSRENEELRKGDGTAIQYLLDRIKKAPDEIDFSSSQFAGFSAEQKSAMESYRDSLLDKRDKTVEGGAKTGISDAFISKMDASSEKLAQAADNLASASKDSIRTAPLAQR